VAVPPRVSHVLAQQRRRQRLVALLRRQPRRQRQRAACARSALDEGPRVLRRGSDGQHASGARLQQVRRDGGVVRLVRAVEEHKNEVEARQEGRTHVDVLNHRLAAIVPPASRIRGRKQRAARRQAG